MTYLHGAKTVRGKEWGRHESGKWKYQQRDMLLSETSKTCKNMYNVCVHIYIYIIPDGSGVKNQPANAGDLGLIPRLGNPLEKEMATHSSTLAWEIP